MNELDKVRDQRNQSSKHRNSKTKSFVIIDEIATFNSGYFNAKSVDRFIVFYTFFEIRIKNGKEAL